ncbi:MAG TPA: cell envelope integrity protein TolA [Xanthomonadaceae bacterium]|nr:cell envelope integrity protein TolA [Xanthomonadaceae bacterium]
MRETRADTTLAVTAALLLHALIFAALLLGLRWQRPMEAGAGEPVSAQLVDANALSAATLRALAEPSPPTPAPTPAAPPPQPLPVPVPEDAQVPRQSQPQQQLPQPDTREQERVDRNAVSPETAPKEQDELHRQAQVDLTDLERQQKEAEQKRALAQRMQERAQQLADIRRQREEAAKDARLAQQKLQQIRDAQSRNAAEAAAQADAAASAPPGERGTDTGLLAKYRAALQSAITQNWTRPDSVPLGQRCKIVIRQLPGGQVVDAQVDPSCPYDEAGRRSIEAAVLKAQPLPYAGFEPVFQRTLILNFEAQDR